MRLAITGGAGEGKSTVASYVRERGIPVSSADEIARRVFEMPAAQEGLSKILGTAEPVSREQLRDRMFGEKGLRRRVNSLLHPLIFAAMKDAREPVMEVPLLFESCLQGQFERIWVVACSPEEQLRRLVLRLGNEADARRVIAAQLPTSVKCQFADRIIRTNSAPDTVRSYVIEAIACDLSYHLA